MTHPTKNIYQTAILSVLTGGIIYVFLRPAPAIFFLWLHRLGFSEWLETVRPATLSLTPLLPGWVVYSLPQGLWAFAYALIMTGIWGRQRSAAAIFWLATIPLLTLGFEGLQSTGLIRGTFCLNDLLFSLAGIISGATYVYISNKGFASAKLFRPTDQIMKNIT